MQHIVMDKIYNLAFFFSISFIIVFVTVPLIKIVAFHVGAVDRGEERRIHVGEIPRLGGVAIFIAFLVVSVVIAYRSGISIQFNKFFGMLAGSSIVFLLGVYDDIKGAGIWIKLTVQAVAASVIYYFGIRINVIFNPFEGSEVSLVYLGLPATILWIIVITNAVNLIDGLDGLAAGTGILIAITLSLMTNDFVYISLLVALVGALLGFLKYNFYPASIFMGDSGSLFLGFFLGAMSIANYQKGAALITLLIPVMAFGFPLMDMFYAVLRRFARGIPIGQADKEHIHHKLVEWGLSKRKAVYVLYFFNFCLMFLALHAMRSRSDVTFIYLVVFVVVVIIGIKIFGYLDIIPSIKAWKKSFIFNRRRKYFSFILSKLGKDLEKIDNKNIQQFLEKLTAFLRSLEFDFANIRISYRADNEIYHILIDGNKSDNDLIITIPMLNGKRKVGYVELGRKFKKNKPYVSMDLLILTFSKEIPGLLKKYFSFSNSKKSRRRR